MSTSIIDSQEPAYLEEHEIDVLTRRIAELEAENERLCRAGYEIGFHDGAKRMAELESLVRDMYGELEEASSPLTWVVGGDRDRWLERMNALGIDTEVGGR